MGLYLSSKQAQISRSEIRNMTRECHRLSGINLAQGICDTDVLKLVKDGAKKAIDEGFNTYTRYDGLQELREAIAERHEQRTGISVDPEKQVIVTSGTTGAFYSAALAILNPGDEVIVFEPYYSYHISTLESLGVKPLYVKLRLPDWFIDFNEIKKSITSKTRGIIVNTPSNPSGKVFSFEELRMIGEIAEKYDLFIFTDEIYEDFVYENAKHISPVTAGDLFHRTITISGFSKIFSITGWRIGYCICDEKWAEAIGHINDLVYVCAPAPLQAGVIRGLNEIDKSYYKKIAVRYENKRDRFCAALNNAGFEPIIPKGAYYVLANISRVKGENSKEKAMNLLHITGIAGVPGEAFYNDKSSGASLIRFCFAKDDKLIDEVCQRISSYQ